MWWHGCFSVQIYHQGKEFGKLDSTELPHLISSEHCVIGVYHPQANDFVKRQNYTIKNSLIKVLGNKPIPLPYILEDEYFSCRVSKHTLTKNSLPLLCIMLKNS